MNKLFSIFALSLLTTASMNAMQNESGGGFLKAAYEAVKSTAESISAKADASVIAREAATRKHGGVNANEFGKAIGNWFAKRDLKSIWE